MLSATHSHVPLQSDEGLDRNHHPDRRGQTGVPTRPPRDRCSDIGVCPRRERNNRETVASVRNVADLVQDAQFELFEDSGHGPCFEEPERFNRVASRLVDSTDTRPDSSKRQCTEVEYIELTSLDSRGAKPAKAVLRGVVRFTNGRSIVEPPPSPPLSVRREAVSELLWQGSECRVRPPRG